MGSAGLSFSLEWVEHATPDYLQWVALREEILRKPLGLSFSEEELAGEKGDLHLVAKEAGTSIVVGGLELVPLPEGCAKVRQVAVAERCRGSGLGRALMSEGEACAIREGWGTIVLHARLTVREFYDQIGYIEEGEVFEEVGIPHIRMKKTLSP